MAMTAKEIHQRCRQKNKKKYAEKSAAYLKTPKGRYCTLLSWSKRNNWPVDITMDEHASLLSKPCYYCGDPLNSRGYGLDRVDSDKGYLLDNIVPCCKKKKCNQAKMNLTVKEFSEWVEKVYKNFVIKELTEEFDWAALQALRKASA
jgi:hypothetical protein